MAAKKSLDNGDDIYDNLKKNICFFLTNTKGQERQVITMALIHFNTQGFDRARDSDIPVLVDFWATWCGPCQMLGPVIEQLAEEYEGKDVVIGKVDVDENPDLAARYGIMSVPTVILFKDGAEVERKVGVMPFDVYAEFLDGTLS